MTLNAAPISVGYSQREVPLVTECREKSLCVPEVSRHTFDISTFRESEDRRALKQSLIYNTYPFLMNLRNQKSKVHDAQCSTKKLGD
jgi:hypothetical protein